VQALLAAGCDGEVVNAKGATPLLETASIGHLEVVQMLLAAGADRGATTVKGYTAVHMAAVNGR
jgi:ankyrin repeat protein